jgi:hypothetical protein
VSGSIGLRDDAALLVADVHPLMRKRSANLSITHISLRQ